MNPQIVFLLNKSLESIRNSNLGSAELFLKQALKLQSSNPHVLRLLGVVYAQRKEYSDAIRYLNCSLRADPKNSLGLCNLGNIFTELKEYDNAIDAYDKSIKIDPKNHEAWSNKGNALYELSRYDEAIDHYDKALLLMPNYAEGWSNKGNALKELKRFKEAISNYDQALILKPSYHDASWNKSLCLLLLGDFENGLPLYESRWSSEEVSKFIGGKRPFIQPTWLGGESLQDKTILLYGEQGLGDFIMFSRYVTLLSDIGAKVILETPQSLASLMSNLEGVSELVIKDKELPFFEYQCSLLSLPLAFQTNLSNIPNSVGYINLDKQFNKIVEWKQKIGLKIKPRIGLVWSGNPNHRNDHNRSLLLEDIVPFLPNQLEYISLQKEVREVDKLTLESNNHILDYGSYLNDFVDTAALIYNLDLIISVDTSVAHLSGALGKKTWLLLPSVPDWRWLLDREDSPWYPSMTIYRQQANGDWNSVLDRVGQDLSRSF